MVEAQGAELPVVLDRQRIRGVHAVQRRVNVKRLKVTRHDLVRGMAGVGRLIGGPGI
jgi:hypothetical protein